ncbi:flagellar motor protein MotD [Lysobacter sp. TY2-98]|uniref:flagellar motor protein MotD n=1 Tax=Lysobacter sp. TY2-98 TaxID=2290922 RepID=UPI000E20C292|nr:flagellar motor protein MotD [Lysobacter sp. TY2-98]AXK71170.1 flagellar motor protein MotD [Lysobacter sp. TY2-98]
MARRFAHEEHVNHEAWAIPYGDLVTLLLAFFVVMYAISSVNAGKYRAVADSLSTAFGGPPKSMAPVQLGRTQLRGSDYDRPSLATAGAAGPTRSAPVNVPRLHENNNTDSAAPSATRESASHAQLRGLGDRIGDALSGLVQQKLVHVRQGSDYLEVEIQSDLLFPSGSALPNTLAVDTVRKVADVLRGQPNALRVEGYTDNQPIANALYASNWELSAARAASVLHVMVQAGIAPSRLSMTGYAEFQPIADNATVEGRNANRRVLLVILPAGQGADAVTGADTRVRVADAQDIHRDGRTG